MAQYTPDRTPHEQELLNLLGKRIRRNRILLELTHEQLAEKSGISQRSMQAMQAGEMNIRFTTLAKIMKALGLKSWDALLPHWDDIEVPAAPSRKKPTSQAASKRAKKKAKTTSAKKRRR